LFGKTIMWNMGVRLGETGSIRHSKGKIQGRPSSRGKGRRNAGSNRGKDETQGEHHQQVKWPNKFGGEKATTQEAKHTTRSKAAAVWGTLLAGRGRKETMVQGGENWVKAQD